MNKVAFVDLDGVIADNTKRFEKAEEAKQEYLNDPDSFSDERTAAAVFWRTAFDPELVSLDTLIDGAVDALATLAFNGYDIMLLTSRPESMREATKQWLYEHDCPVDLPLIMKPPAAQYVKTVTWKAVTVQMLAALYDAEEVLFVDDEQANRDAVLTGFLEITVASSLAEAIAPPAPESDNPF